MLLLQLSEIVGEVGIDVTAVSVLTESVASVLLNLSRTSVRQHGTTALSLPVVWCDVGRLIPHSLRVRYSCTHRPGGCGVLHVVRWHSGRHLHPPVAVAVVAWTAGSVDGTAKRDLAARCSDRT